MTIQTKKRTTADVKTVILNYISRRKKAPTVGEIYPIAEKHNIAHKTVRNNLGKLIKSGHITTNGSRRCTRSGVTRKTYMMASAA